MLATWAVCRLIWLPPLGEEDCSEDLLDKEGSFSYTSILLHLTPNSWLQEWPLPDYLSPNPTGSTHFRRHPSQAPLLARPSPPGVRSAGSSIGGPRQPNATRASRPLSWWTPSLASHQLVNTPNLSSAGRSATNCQDRLSCRLDNPMFCR